MSTILSISDCKLPVFSCIPKTNSEYLISGMTFRSTKHCNCKSKTKPNPQDILMLVKTLYIIFLALYCL